jgi:hypothetical protein
LMTFYEFINDRFAPKTPGPLGRVFFLPMFLTGVIFLVMTQQAKRNDHRR